MAELVFLGHFFVVAALSHHRGRLRSFVRVPRAVALPSKFWRVLHTRPGLWIGGFHRLGSCLLDNIHHPRRGCGGPRVAAGHAAGGRTVHLAQRGAGTPAGVLDGTLAGAAPHARTLFRGLYPSYGVAPVAGSAVESLLEFRRALACPCPPLFCILSGIAGRPERGSSVGRKLR